MPSTQSHSPANRLRCTEEYEHRWRIRRAIRRGEWSEFIAAVPAIWTKAVEGELGEAPSARFVDAPQTSFDLTVGTSGLTIRGKGIWRLRSGGPSVALCGPGDDGVCHIFPSPPRGWTSRCVTGGRPYDHAVRLALQLLAACAPGAVEIVSSAPRSVWDATAELAAEILDLPGADLEPLGHAPVPQHVEVEPIAGTGLWRALWRKVEILPCGQGALIRAGRAGYVTEQAAYAAAERLALSHSTDGLRH